MPGGLRGYSLYYLQRQGVFRTTVSREYLKSEKKEQGTVAMGDNKKWKLSTVKLTDGTDLRKYLNRTVSHYRSEGFRKNEEADSLVFRLELIMGILGIRAANDNQKIMPVWVLPSPMPYRPGASNN